MFGFNIRRLSRRLSTSLTFLFLFPIFGAVIGEFFIELVKELGWYQNPSARLDATMTAFSNFVTQTWFLVVAAFLAGLTTGLWTDAMLRRREAALALRAIPQPPVPTGEPGQLDYIVEGIQSFNDITDIFQSATKEIARISRTMSRYTFILQFVGDFNRRRKLAYRLAVKLNKFSQSMLRYVPLIADAGRRTHVNCLAVIEGTPILDHDSLGALLGFANTLKQMVDNSDRSTAAMNESRNAVASITGISRELNAAAELFSTTIESLSAENRAYGDICRQLLDVATTKATQATAALANQAGFPSPQLPPSTARETRP